MARVKPPFDLEWVPAPLGNGRLPRFEFQNREGLPVCRECGHGRKAHVIINWSGETSVSHGCVKFDPEVLHGVGR